jgi:RNA polymerase subunit RPABC4/transcription elongation factor Spt4
MAFCASCGTQLNEGAKFCPSCGTPAGGVAPATPAAEKVGNIRKCPACGAEVPAMSAICSACGHEFSNVQVANSVQSFFEKLDAIDSEAFAHETAQAQAKAKTAAPSSLSGAFATLLTSPEAMSGVSDVSPGEKRKMALIEGFPIPNSKEDILEFLIMATSRIKPMPSLIGFGAKASQSEINSTKRLNQAWASKCQQVYNKAKISMGTDKETIAQVTAALDTVNQKKCGVSFAK